MAKYEALKDFYSSSLKRDVKQGEVIELKMNLGEIEAKFGKEYVKEAVTKSKGKASTKKIVEKEVE